MASVSAAISQALGSPLLTLYNYRNKTRINIKTKILSLSMNNSSQSEYEKDEEEWKTVYKKEFEQRFELPHITRLLRHAPSFPSTFRLRMRSTKDEMADGFLFKDTWHGYINNDDRVLLKVIRYTSPTSAGAECIDPDCSWVEQWVHRAGPREKIYYKPEEVKAAIVTCGGLCPGLNDVIRQIVITLEIYGVEKIVGIPFGYRGFSDKDLSEIQMSDVSEIALRGPLVKKSSVSRQVVQNVHLSGGSLLGVSRGGPSVSDIVDSIEERGINMLFVLGGNGTHAGANAIHDECCKRRLKVAVVGVPKTIDNDILLMDKTFGFDTAVEEAQRAINSAYIEAHSAYRGIGIVKLMGRSSGFIAMHASLASGQVDICLIPEVSFDLHGPHGILRHLQYLLETKGSAVVCVAEGAGQNFLQQTNVKDASGNAVLGDIGVHLQKEIKKYFKEIGSPADTKYIDPTYMIRAVRANASDGILCAVLGQNAVHGAFAGYSGITVGICNTHYVYLPIPEVISYPRLIDPNSRMWHRCLTSTGQPDFI